MTKPRRKHPAFNVIDASPQGEVFLSIMMSFLGEEVWWKPLERTADRSVVFLIGGSRGSGILVQSAEKAEGDRWVRRWGFRYEPADLGVVVHMELVANRWDPWLHAQITGDSSIVDGPVGRRRRLTDERDEEIGREHDQYRMTVLSGESSPRVLCGLPMEEIEAILESHTEDREDGRDVDVIAPEAPDVPVDESLLRGHFPLVD